MLQLAQTAQGRRDAAAQLVAGQISFAVTAASGHNLRTITYQSLRTHKYVIMLMLPSSDGMLPLSWLLCKSLLQSYKIHRIKTHDSHLDIMHNAQLLHLAQIAQF
jgi:hypothetical protein